MLQRVRVERNQKKKERERKRAAEAKERKNLENLKNAELYSETMRRHSRSPVDTSTDYTQMRQSESTLTDGTDASAILIAPLLARQEQTPVETSVSFPMPARRAMASSDSVSSPLQRQATQPLLAPREPMLHEILSGVQETVDSFLYPPPLHPFDSEESVVPQEDGAMEVMQEEQAPLEEPLVFAKLLTPGELREQQQKSRQEQQTKQVPHANHAPVLTKLLTPAEQRQRDQPPQEECEPQEVNDPVVPMEPIEPSAAAPQRRPRTQWRKMTAREKAEALQMEIRDDPAPRTGRRKSKVIA